MKVINSKTIVGALVVMYIIGFFTVPNLVGLCNYPDKGYENLEVKIDGHEKVWYYPNPDDCNEYTYKCFVCDQDGNRLKVNDEFDNSVDDYLWDWSPHLEFRNQYHNRINVVGISEAEHTYIYCMMKHDGLEGLCVGFFYVDVEMYED